MFIGTPSSKNDEPLSSILSLIDNGKSIKESCETHGITRQRFYSWCRKLGLNVRSNYHKILEIDLNKFEELCKRAKDGESINALCRELGLKRNTVYQKAKRLGLELKSEYTHKPFKFDEQTRITIFKQYKSGKTSTELAEQFGCDHKTICSAIKSCGGSIRSVEDNRSVTGNPIYNSIRNSYKKSKSAKKFGFTLSNKEFDDLITSKCYYCGVKPTSIRFDKPLDKELSICGIDRVDSSQGYHLTNVVSCCKRCNQAKNDMTVREFKTWIKRIYEHFLKLENNEV